MVLSRIFESDLYLTRVLFHQVMQLTLGSLKEEGETMWLPEDQSFIEEVAWAAHLRKLGYEGELELSFVGCLNSECSTQLPYICHSGLHGMAHIATLPCHIRT